MKVTDNMLEILKSGGSFKFQGWVVTAATRGIPKDGSQAVFAVSPSGGNALEHFIEQDESLDEAVQKIFTEINSSSYLPESAYRNGIRLDTENRCQSSRCNPSPGGKPRLLFVSAGQINQVIQIKCKCGYMNTFWRNRIKMDASGALQVEAA